MVVAVDVPFAGTIPHMTDRRLPRTLILASVLYLALRALVLVSNFDSLAVPLFELGSMGNLAKIVGGGGGGVPLYRYYDNVGGQLATGVIAIPFYAVLGDSYLVLKLVPLTLGLGSLVLIWFILDRHYDKRAANLAILLFALTPPTLAKYSMIAMGSHFENLLFQFAAYALFFRAHARGCTAWSLLAASAAAGFATFFYFGTLVLLLGLACVHVGVRGPLRSLRDLPVALAGFAAGIAPLIWIQWKTGRVGLFVGAELGRDKGNPLGHLVDRVGHFVTEVLPRAGVFQNLGPVPGSLAEVAFLACFATAWLSLLPSFARGLRRAFDSLRKPAASSRERERLANLKLTPLLLYLPTLAVVLGVSNLDFDRYGSRVEVGPYRYLVQHFAFATMLIGVAASALIGSGGWRRTLGLALSATALATGLFTLPIVDWSFERPNLGLHYPGYHPRHYSNMVLQGAKRDPATGRIALDFAAVTDTLSDLPPALRKEVYFGIGSWLAAVELQNQSIGVQGETHGLPLTELFDPFPRSHAIDLARGAGSQLRRLDPSQDATRGELVRILRGSSGSSDPLVPYAIEGLCMEYRFHLEQRTFIDLNRSAAMEPVVPPEHVNAWRRGQGIQSGRLLRRSIASDVRDVLARADVLPEPARSPFWFGVGWGMADEKDFESLPQRFDAWVPEAQRGSALTGYGAALRHLYGPRAAERVKRLAEALSLSDRAVLERGAGWPQYPRPLEGRE